MKKFISNAVLATVITLTASATANAGQLEDLLIQVKADRVSEAKLDKKREAEFLSARADKQALLKKAEKQLANEQARNARLTKEFAENEITLANKEVELKNALGTLGEMLGIARGAGAKAYGKVATSIVSAEYPGREVILDKIANAKEIPNLAALEELWFSLQTEMTQSGQISSFNADITELDGSKRSGTVTRIGTFNLVTTDGYLNFNDELGLIQPLAKQPDGYIVGLVNPYFSTTSGYAALYVDPSKGAILNLETRKKSLEERYHQGGLPGYVITVVLLLGFLIALERFWFLGTTGAKIRSQLKNTDQPNENNPLGRLLKVYQDNRAADAETLELKLDEAILRETPKVERGVNMIKIFAAIAPLLGLLGTVVGMIGTFQAITLFGTGDPKIMAGNISMALVTTAQGLIAALPLILVHSMVASKAKAIFHTLDEQAAGIIASIAEKENK